MSHLIQHFSPLQFFLQYSPFHISFSFFFLFSLSPKNSTNFYQSASFFPAALALPLRYPHARHLSSTLFSPFTSRHISPPRSPTHPLDRSLHTQYHTKGQYSTKESVPDSETPDAIAAAAAPRRGPRGN